MDERNDISALFKKPPVNLNQPSIPVQAPPAAATPSRSFRFADRASHPVSKPTAKPTEPKKDFSLVDFSKGGVIKDASIYDKTFRYKTNQALKGTLKRFADRKAVADLLWDKRGYGGLNKGEIKSGLRKLESQGKLRSDQVRAVRRKIGLY